MKNNIIINVADLPDPDDEQGRTYRQINSLKVHEFPVGTVVEVWGPRPARITAQVRDCDATPLYCLELVGNYGEESFNLLNG